MSLVTRHLSVFRDGLHLRFDFPPELFSLGGGQLARDEKGPAQNQFTPGKGQRNLELVPAFANANF
jgi:hypothetical protein